jgi:hypothetical protein
MNTFMNIKSTAAIMGIVLLGGCFESNEEKIIGYWNCQLSAATGSGTGLTQYVSGGDWSGEAELNLVEDGISMSIAVVGAGTWSIDGDEIIERTTNMSVMELVVGGVTVPPSSLPSEFLETIMASATASTIVTFDDDNLIMRNPDQTATCRRR